ncbi:19928_t:CDS:2 [Cetraspora pellucida]|uniref:19928_t:CDS:1 n=1 Tax=Cetraspora pellucida TaxID=1433469 RepID=A0A9N8ZMF1_9GLOM|nr:19928_t:CDS:2 [Cetraspora pellucida]
MVGKTNMDEFGMGGSSGGSAAVALECASRGSIRLPASYCGVIGFKPSYGQCSQWRLVTYASSLDTVGIIAQNVLDAQLIDPIQNLCQQGISLLRSHGATIVSVSCPSTKYALPAYYILAPAEASSNSICDMDSTREDELHETKDGDNSFANAYVNDVFTIPANLAALCKELL